MRFKKFVAFGVCAAVLGLAVGCGGTTDTKKTGGDSKMSGDKMGDGKMGGDKMGDGKMGDGKMGDGKMDTKPTDKMGDGKMDKK